MLYSEGSRTTHNPDTVRRAGLLQRIGRSLGPPLGFEGPHVNPNLDMGYSSREKRTVAVLAGFIVGGLFLLGVNNAGNRVQEHYDRDAAEYDGSDLNSGQ